MHVVHGQAAASRARDVLTDWAADTAYRWRGMQGECNYTPAWSTEDGHWVLRTDYWSEHVEWTEVLAVPSEDWFAGIDWDADWAMEDAEYLMRDCPLIRLEDIELQPTGTAGYSWVYIHIHGTGPWVVTYDSTEWFYGGHLEVDTIDDLIDVLEHRDEHGGIDAGMDAALEHRLLTDRGFFDDYCQWLYYNPICWDASGLSADMVELLQRGIARYVERRTALRNPRFLRA